MRINLVAFAALILCSPAAASEATTGTVEGHVVDEGGSPLAGVTIVLTGPQVPRTSWTDAAGRFVVRALAPGAYTIEASAEGRPKEALPSLVVHPSETVSLRCRLGKGWTLAPSPEATSAIRLSRPDLAEVPLERDGSSVYALGPVADGGIPETGTINPSISGASGLESAHLVEGVDVTDGGYQARGSYSIVYGSFGAGLTPDLVEEVRVVTGGFDADRRAPAGGTVDTVLPSGTNRFGFEAAWYEAPESFDGTYEKLVLLPNAANRTAALRRDQVVSVSGPLFRDRLFGLAAIDRVTIDERFELTSGDPSVGYVVNDTNGDGKVNGADEPTTFPAGTTIHGDALPSSVTRERVTTSWAAKLTGYASPRQKLEVVAFGDPSSGSVGPQAPLGYLRERTDPFAYPYPDQRDVGLEWGGSRVVLRHQGSWDSRLFTEISFARNRNEFRETGPGTESTSFLSPFLVSSGGVGRYQSIEDRHDQWRASATGVFGPVEVRVGFALDDIDWKEPKLTSGPSFTSLFPRLVDHVPVDVVNNQTGAPDPDGVQDVYDNGQPVFGIGLLGDGSTGASYTPVRGTSGAEFFDQTLDSSFLQPTGQFTTSSERSAFAQARWDVTSALSVTAGLRLTKQKIEGSGSFTLPISSLHDGTPSGVGSTSYIPRAYTFPGEIAPRLGAVWDVRSDGRHKLFASVGRYFQRVASDVAQRTLSNEVSIVGEDWDFSSVPIVPARHSECLASSAGAGGLYDTQVPCHEIDGIGMNRPIPIVDGSYDPESDGSGNRATRLPYTDEWLAGYAVAAGEMTSIEVRVLGRRLGRIVEDVGLASAEQIENMIWGTEGTNIRAFTDPFPGHGAAPFSGPILANPGANVDSRLLPPPARDYRALEATLETRPRGGWQAWLSYRFSELRGNYVASYNPASGQSDPNNMTAYDLAAASGIDTNADGRIDSYIPSGLLSGAYATRDLPTDRRHVLHAWATKRFENGLALGGSLSVLSGQPRTATLANPIYRNSGDIPGSNPTYWWLVRVDTGEIDPVTGQVVYDGVIDSRAGVYTNPNPQAPYPVGLLQDFNGDGIPDRVVPSASGSRTYLTAPRLHSYDVGASDRGRTGTDVGLDLHASWDLRLRSSRSTLSFLLDAFNVAGRTSALAYDDRIETRPGSPNPNDGKVIAYRLPRYVRLGAKFTW